MLVLSYPDMEAIISHSRGGKRKDWLQHKARAQVAFFQFPPTQCSFSPPSTLKCSFFLLFQFPWLEEKIGKENHLLLNHPLAFSLLSSSPLYTTALRGYSWLAEVPLCVCARVPRCVFRGVSRREKKPTKIGPYFKCTWFSPTPLPVS